MISELDLNILIGKVSRKDKIKIVNSDKKYCVLYKYISGTKRNCKILLTDFDFDYENAARVTVTRVLDHICTADLMEH